MRFADRLTRVFPGFQLTGIRVFHRPYVDGKSGLTRNSLGVVYLEMRAPAEEGVDAGKPRGGRS